MAENNNARNGGFDQDGRSRTGTMYTATAHIITAVIGSGVLSLAWALAQLGWVVGPTVLIVFSLVTFYTSTMLADSYRAPGPVSGRRNPTYTEVVRSHLGGYNVILCGIAQYANLVGITIGYTITASTSLVAVMKSNCFHDHGHRAKCNQKPYRFVLVFALIQIILGQIQDFHKISWLSVVAAAMSFTYSLIGLGLSIATVAAGPDTRTTLTGATVGVDVTLNDKILHAFQALGDIAFSYAYSTVLIEIQDTLRSDWPENETMKKASLIGVTTTTVFYILCGCMGYAAFGNVAPGNFLTGFGFYEPFWLIDIANICIAIHLIGGYQVFCQPLFAFVELQSQQRWPTSQFIHNEHIIHVPYIGAYNLNYFRLVWRTVYICVTSLVAGSFPFFNEFLGLLGACSFYPLTVYFPVEIHISQKKIPRFSRKWFQLKVLSWICLAVSLVAAAGAIQGLSKKVMNAMFA